MNKPRIMLGVDVFSGAGGLSLGAEMAGIDVKFAVEVWPSAAATYRKNHPHATVINEDITNIHPKEDILHNGEHVLQSLILNLRRLNVRMSGH